MQNERPIHGWFDVWEMDEADEVPLPAAALKDIEDLAAGEAMIGSLRDAAKPKIRGAGQGALFEMNQEAFD